VKADAASSRDENHIGMRGDRRDSQRFRLTGKSAEDQRANDAQH
jgi:hypothetical protein